MIEDANASIDGTHSKENQGPWLKKTMVSLWSIPGTSKRRKILTPQRKPLVKAQALQGSCSCQRSRGEIRAKMETIQITMCAQIGVWESREAAARCVLEGGGGANEGWTVLPEILKRICTYFEPAVFDTLLKKFLVSNPNLVPSAPRHRSETWQLISANVN